MLVLLFLLDLSLRTSDQVVGSHPVSVLVTHCQIPRTAYQTEKRPYNDQPAPVLRLVIRTAE